MSEAGSKVVALTGATGFLGSHIADVLLAAGYQVKVSVRGTSSLRWLEGKDLDVREVDLLCFDSCLEFLDGTTSVIHCAGVVSATSDQAYATGNVETTGQLLKAAKSTWSQTNEPSPTFLLISSLAAHGPAGRHGRRSHLRQ